MVPDQSKYNVDALYMLFTPSVRPSHGPAPSQKHPLVPYNIRKKRKTVFRRHRGNAQHKNPKQAQQ